MLNPTVDIYTKKPRTHSIQEQTAHDNEQKRHTEGRRKKERNQQN